MQSFQTFFKSDLGDRLRGDQLKNYRLLEIANNLVARWPLQTKSLLAFEQDSVSTIMNAIRESISTIIASMHREISSRKGVSPYMQVQKTSTFQ